MSPDLHSEPKKPVALMGLVAAQLVCAAYFLFDVFADFQLTSGEPHLIVEFLAAILLIVTALVLYRQINAMMQRQARLQQAVSVASAAIAEVIEAHFTDWRLTPTEHEIANLLVKGLPITEIARIRGSAEGTVKSHLNAIYRKSGSQNRGELLSQIIDSLMARDAET